MQIRMSKTRISICKERAKRKKLPIPMILFQAGISEYDIPQRDVEDQNKIKYSTTVRSTMEY